MGSVFHSIVELLVLAQRELLLFVGVFFTIGALDEVVVDLMYLRARWSGRHETVFAPPPAQALAERLSGWAAVFIPVWREEQVIAATIRHALASWPQQNVTIYIGCYCNDPLTMASAMAGVRDDPRVRLVVNERGGPTTKSDCLNRMWRALRLDEQRRGEAVRMVLMQDAEDMVDPCALALCDREIGGADMVQLPVIALAHRATSLVSGHYSDEFAEAHGKTLVVRDALGAAIPGAGVGCAIARPMLGRLNASSGAEGPFAPLALTEDYELGLRIAQLGGKTRFIRARDEAGELIATRAFFPSSLGTSIRQKTRWIHGISLQGWDRLGWSGTLASQWMQLRDRKGPLAALLLALAYVLALITLALWSLRNAGLVEPAPLPALATWLVTVNLLAFAWRACIRAWFSAREHGWRAGLMAIPRLFVANIIAIIAGRRAFAAYLATLRGAAPVWDKTDHVDHPAFARIGSVAA